MSSWKPYVPTQGAGLGFRDTSAQRVQRDVRDQPGTRSLGPRSNLGPGLMPLDTPGTMDKSDGGAGLPAHGRERDQSTRSEVGRAPVVGHYANDSSLKPGVVPPAPDKMRSDPRVTAGHLGSGLVHSDPAPPAPGPKVLDPDAWYCRPRDHMSGSGLTLAADEVRRPPQRQQGSLGPDLIPRGGGLTVDFPSNAPGNARAPSYQRAYGR
jgi:hypothetical protein